MDFTYSEEHQAVADLAAQIIAEHCDPARLSRLEREGWFDRDLWSALAAAGMLGIALPESVGGAGLDTLALHPILQAVGANAAHVPLAETLLAALVVDRHGSAAQCQALLPGVVSGQLVLTVALVDDEPADLHTPSARLQPGPGNTHSLTGVKTLVPCAALADRHLVSASTPDGGVALVLVDPSRRDVEVVAQETPSDVPHARVTYADVPIDSRDVVGALDGAALATLINHGRSALASLQVGVVMEAVRLAAQHTGQREQFGRQIATFQAVSQRVADARIAAGMLDLVALQAAWRLAQGMACADELAIAGWWTGEAGHGVLHAVHHVHGGIGVDRDYPLHRLFGRAKQYEFALGGSSQHLVDLGHSLAAQPA